ncbi:MAG: N-6 DNA methylase, partial [Calditrichaeota bacterium]|nr:N-6 DNA methylase [Calditrichota bacterium]
MSCAREADFASSDSDIPQYAPFHEIATAGTIADELNDFSAFRLADGTFWEDNKNKDIANYDKAAHRWLIQEIFNADKELKGAKNPIKRRLLVLIVLIKYLEDREVFPKDLFDKHCHGAKCFFDVLKSDDPQKVIALLTELENRFNGDIFKVPNAEENQITKEILIEFAYLIEGRTLNNQRYLWKQFSFKHLPVEIISHIYQKFVKSGKGVVYTPPILADLLLDMTMPYTELIGNERIIDPACGSGIFLVGAFKRLINIWRGKNKWAKPDVDILKKILNECIFGIELDENAIHLTAFSLSLAICDALQPEIIWDNLKFDQLVDSNLIKADFFQELLDSRNGANTILNDKFDIVIGNPPFKSKLSQPAIELVVTSKKDKAGYIPSPDKQIAYLFLKESISILRSNGKSCLLQNAGFLYNSKPFEFRSNILKNHKVEVILDFISITALFEVAKAKVVALLIRNEAVPENHVIKHWTFRRTKSIKERICFELDHYDRHFVTQRQAETDPLIWRICLFGGGRLLGLSRRLRKMRTLEEFIVDKGWDYGEGFVIGNRKKMASHITGKPVLPTRCFTEKGMKVDKEFTVQETHFERPRDAERFTPPLVLIKEHSSLPMEFWDNGNLAYRNEIVGIHVSNADKNDLYEFYRTLLEIRDIFKLSCTLNGYRLITSRATAISKADIDSFPYPKMLSDLNLSFWEKALLEDTLNHFTHYVSKGQESNLLKYRAN